MMTPDRKTPIQARIRVRPEHEADAGAIRTILTAAFESSAEAELVEALRQSGAAVLSRVATVDENLVGHILFTPVRLVSSAGEQSALALGPMAVAPAWQRRGAGAALVRAGLQDCRREGHDVVFVVGHPSYYPRFGFTVASQHGFECEFDVPAEAFMVAELRPGALSRLQGRVYYCPEFGQTG